MTAGLVGWPGFKDVFTISALNGDGVSDLRQYLLASAKDGDWRYAENVMFDKDPREIVINIVKSKFLEHLPGPVPYQLEPEISIWEFDTTWDTLNIVMTVDAKNKNIFKVILGSKGSNAVKMSRDIEDTLSNFFSHRVRFKLTAVPKFTVSLEDHRRSTLKPNFSI